MWTAKQIAEELGVEPNTVTKYSREFFSEEEKEQMKAIDGKKWLYSDSQKSLIVAKIEKFCNGSCRKTKQNERLSKSCYYYIKQQGIAGASMSELKSMGFGYYTVYNALKIYPIEKRDNRYYVTKESKKYIIVSDAYQKEFSCITELKKFLGVTTIQISKALDEGSTLEGYYIDILED